MIDITAPDFAADLSIDPTMCNHGNEVFELFGPAPGNSATKANSVTWVSSVDNVLTIETTDYTSVDYDGSYSVTHSNGKSEGTFELLICAVKIQPGAENSSTIVK